MRNTRAIGLVLGTLGMLATAAPARAADEQVVVEREQPASTVGVVAKDALYGGIAGAAIGGGILLIQQDGWDTGTMALSTGIGLLAGAVLGIIDAATQHPRPVAEATPDVREQTRPLERAQTTASGLPGAFSLSHGVKF